MKIWNAILLTLALALTPAGATASDTNLLSHGDFEPDQATVLQNIPGLTYTVGPDATNIWFGRVGGPGGQFTTYQVEGSNHYVTVGLSTNQNGCQQTIVWPGAGSRQISFSYRGTGNPLPSVRICGANIGSTIDTFDDADTLTLLTTISLSSSAAWTTVSQTVNLTGSYDYLVIQLFAGDFDDVSITTAVPPPVVTTTSLPNATIGVAYSQTLAVEGGAGGLTWNVDSGELPAGLSLAADGILSGTPTTAGTSTFAVKVTDQDSGEGTQALSLTVDLSGTVTASVTPTRTSGVAPLAVYFDTTGTTGSATSRPFHELDYEWDYGDTGSGVWAASGKSKNRDSGPNGGHVFETPGTYTVTLTVKDVAGATDTKTATITVTDPNVVFSGANTICFSTDGDFTGAPAGSQQITTQSWSTVANALGTGKRVLLKRGNAWNHDGTKRNLTFNGPGILGAFGAGPRPVLRFTSSNDNTDGRVFWTGTGSTPGQFNDFRFMDLEIDGAGYRRGFLWAEGEVDNLTLLRVRMYNGSSLMFISPDIMDYYNQNGKPGHHLSSGIAIVETEFNHIIGPGTEFNGGFVAYLGIQKSLLMGNTWNDSTLGEHVLRFPMLSQGLVAHNEFTNSRALKHLIKLHASPLATITPTESQYVVISDNRLSSQQGDWLVSVGPQNDTSNEVVHDVIVERNQVTIATGYQTAFHLCASQSTVRNNTVVITSEDGGNPVTIARRGVEPVPTGNSVYNNSAYCSGANANLTFVSIDSSAVDTTVRNNLGSAPNTTDKIMISGAGTNLQQSGNLLTDTPGWRAAAPAWPVDFHLTVGSPAVDAGNAAPVFTDFAETSRPQGATWDIGAFEYPTDPGVSTPAITTTTLPNGIVNMNYSKALSGQGGDIAQVWSLVSGSLPPGLRLSGATILGTPTTVGAYTFTVKLSDLDANTDASDEDAVELTIMIDPPPNLAPTITTTAVPAGVPNTAYTYTLQGTGGDGALVWSLDSGALPAGLSLSAAGVISGTPTTAGTYPFTVRVADSDTNTGPADEATREWVLTVNPTGSLTVFGGPAFTTTAFAAQTGTFTVTFSAKPSVAATNTVIGLANDAATAFSQIACAVRFFTANSFDARNGDAYEAASTIPYVPGQIYRFRLVVNVPAHTYSIYVTPPGGSEQTIGSNYAFRTEQNAVTQLDTFVVNDGDSGDSWVEITNFAVTAPAMVVLGNLTQTYDGAPKPVAVTTVPAGLPINVTYDGSATPPTNAGTYAVVATIADPSYTGSASGTLTIRPAGALIAFDGLHQTYDGMPKLVTAVTIPGGLPVTVTYGGGATPPTLPGTYAVEATLDDPNHSGAAMDTLTIGITALVRHAPTLNGGLDGSLQVLNAENIILNGSAWISGDLLVPGTPQLKLNGHPSYGGTLDAAGASTPAGSYAVTLNGNALLRHVVRRVDPIAWPAVDAPPAPAGTVNVTLNHAGQNVGDWSTLRNLTLNGGAGVRAVPPGAYGVLTANGNGGFILGIAGASEPAVYALQGLVINGNASVQVVGPVVLTLAGGVTLNGTVGSPAHPEWLLLRVVSGGVTLNGNVALHGTVIAPSGAVVINGNSTVHGDVRSDRLTLNGNAELIAPEN